MVLTNAERQRSYRQRRKAGEPPRRYATVNKKDRQSRLQRWQAAAEELLALQEEYRAWYDNLPENLQDTALTQKLKTVCELDLEEIASIELPLGFGRDEPLQRRFSRRQITSQPHPCLAVFLKAYGWFVFRFVRVFPGRVPRYTPHLLRG